MKQSNKKICFAVSILLLVIKNGFSQNIELPEVTTVVSGENVIAQEDDLPSFSDVIIIPQKSESGEIILPEVTVSSSDIENKSEQERYQKNIFAEGKIGGGFPTLFTGEFSVFKVTPESPFKIYFLYDSAAGYANHLLTDGFSDQTVNFAVDKGYSKNNLSLNFGGGYNSFSNGLQNIQPEITKINQNQYFGDVDFSYNLQKNIILGAFFDLDFYNRYADALNNNVPTALFFSISPLLFADWSGYGFKTKIEAKYLLEKEFKNAVFGNPNNRAEISAKVEWSNDMFRIFSKAALVFGNSLNNHKVLVPFSLDIESTFPVYFSNRKVSVYAEGGLKSYENRISELEKKYRFSSVEIMPFETSDWYGKIGFSVPLKESFVGAAEFEYTKTAFSNGKWQPFYNDDYLKNGLYIFNNKQMQCLKSRIEISYHYKIFSLIAGWKSNWIDVPVLENMHQVYLNLNFQSENSKWGIDFKFIQPLEYEFADPIINFEGFVKLTQAVRAVFSAQDIVKLFKAEPRIYCGNYYEKGGTATVLLKFFF